VISDSQKRAEVSEVFVLGFGRENSKWKGGVSEWVGAWWYYGTFGIFLFILHEPVMGICFQDSGFNCMTKLLIR